MDVGWDLVIDLSGPLEGNFEASWGPLWGLLGPLLGLLGLMGHLGGSYSPGEAVRKCRAPGSVV